MFWFRKKKTGIGLAFGGGSIRCLAHVGVYNILDKNNIYPKCVSGNSAGAIIAALVACGFSAERIEQVVMELDWFKFIQPHLNFTGLFSSKRIYDFMRKVLPVRYFGETKIPLAIVTTDLITGQPVVFHKPEDEIALAVMASCTVPGLYAPVKYKHYQLVDGCLVNNVPVSLLDSYAPACKVAVNVIPAADMTEPPSSIFNVFSRLNDVYILRNRQAELAAADIVLEPLKEYVSVFKPSLKLYRQLIKYGEEEAQRNISKIRKYA